MKSLIISEVGEILAYRKNLSNSYDRSPSPDIETLSKGRPSQDLKHEISCLVTLYQDISLLVVGTHVVSSIYYTKYSDVCLFICPSVRL